MILSLGIAIMALGLGQFFVGKPAGGVRSRFECLFIAFALGYGLLAYFIYLVGITIGFNTPIVVVIFAVAAIFSGVGFLQFFKHGGKISFDSLKKIIQTREELLLAFWVEFFVLLLVLGAFLPPTAHDALCYHLNIPRRWAQDGSIGYYPYLVNSLFPFLIQIYYGIGILFQADYAAHFFHLFCLLGTLVGVFALARRFGNSWGAWAAVLILISTPGIFNQANLPLNDIALMFFSFAMLYAVFLAIEDNFSPRFFIIAGMLGGFALGIKYFAVLHIAAAAVAALFFAIQSKVAPRRIFQSVILFSVFAGVFGGAWYLRAWILEGNPVYPYFSNVFQGGDSAGYNFAKQGYGKGLINLFLIPWQATMEPKKFGGTWTNLGLIYLVFLPLLFIKSNHSKVRFFTIAAACYFVSWFFVVQNLRFLYFVLPVLCVLIALQTRNFRLVLYPLLILNTAFAVFHSRDAFVYWGKQESREAYLVRVDPAHQVIREVNKRVPADEKILIDDLVRLYYLNAEPIRAREFLKRNAINWVDPEIFEKTFSVGIYWVVARRETLEAMQMKFGLDSAVDCGNGFVLLKLQKPS